MKTNIVLIDFENVQPKDLAKLHGTGFQVKVFCGANQSKIPLDLAEQLQPLGPNLHYLRIQGAGHNALDFHIAYYIGRLSVQSPGATFYIISQDQGFEPLVKHLETQNITCYRLPSLDGLPVIPPAAKPASPLVKPAAPVVKPTAPTVKPVAPDRIQKVAHGLLTRKEARPRKLQTLTAFIKCQLNNQATEAAVAEVLTRLTRGGLTTGAEGKLTWP